ncbi:6235_t:CDS:2 [Diversispora eburnea]|uniref:6235_t:CDS:1 n=1 Tax=Diversispora eburnea TaxID=1213867 RepID=A0A9N9AU53_9GLOM|nr:6235_t:CDS:2 [Diversispora eburnea]
MSNAPEKCILAIGKTGNGKSFTGNIFGAKTEVSDSTKSVTNEVAVHDCGNNCRYVDTPGFDDSNEGKDDAETARVILRTMQNKGITNLTTILWFVVPDIRALGSFHRQARFIDTLAQYYDGNVWNNVIIVHKGQSILKGPYDAAKEIAQKCYKLKHGKFPDNDDDLLKKTSNFAILLFESEEVSNLIRMGNFTSDELNSNGIFKESEPERILAVYESLMKEHLEHPIPLEFKNFKCEKCPEYTDPRLAVAECHLDGELIHNNNKVMIHLGNKEMRHPKGTHWCHTEGKEKYHPDGVSKYHANSIQVWSHKNSGSSKIHTGSLRSGEEYETRDHGAGANALRIFTFGIVDLHDTKRNPSYYSCCGGSKDSSGCTTKSSCCDRNPGCELIYTCCQRSGEGCINGHRCCNKPDKSIGCKERYKCCQALERCTNLYECCNKKVGENGCEEFYTCCNRAVKESQGCYPVCEDCHKEHSSKGCKEVCKKCKMTRSENYGCSKVRHNFPVNLPHQLLFFNTRYVHGSSQ